MIGELRGKVKIRVVYSDRVKEGYRNPLTLIGDTVSIDAFLEPGDSPVAVWEFNGYHEACEFVHKHYTEWKHSNGWVKEDWE